MSQRSLLFSFGTLFWETPVFLGREHRSGDIPVLPLSLLETIEGPGRKAGFFTLNQPVALEFVVKSSAGNPKFSSHRGTVSAESSKSFRKDRPLRILQNAPPRLQGLTLNSERRKTDCGC